MARPPGPADLTDEDRRRSSAVVQRLRAAAGRDGFLRFDRFVEIALYAPGDGYYAHRGLRRGAAGDYYTAPRVHPIFGATVARRIRAEFERLGRPASFRVVEVGAGDGTLARDVRTAWDRFGETTALDYVRVDPAPDLDAVDLPDGVRRSTAVAAEGPFSGLVLANELLDAFPFRRLLRRDARWVELGIAVEGATVRWRESDAVDPVPAPALPEAPEGTILEIAPAAEAWIREVADSLVAGGLVLLDYGADQPELIARKPAGTLEAVRAHRASVPPLEAPGTSDLSAWVNFTRLRWAARAAGLVERHYRSQAESLGDWGFEAARADAEAALTGEEARVKLHLASKSLLFGFDRFRVLEFSEGPPAAATSRVAPDRS